MKVSCPWHKMWSGSHLLISGNSGKSAAALSVCLQWELLFPSLLLCSSRPSLALLSTLAHSLYVLHGSLFLIFFWVWFLDTVSLSLCCPGCPWSWGDPPECWDYWQQYNAWLFSNCCIQAIHIIPHRGRQFFVSSSLVHIVSSRPAEAPWDSVCKWAKTNRIVSFKDSTSNSFDRSRKKIAVYLCCWISRLTCCVCCHRCLTVIFCAAFYLPRGT